MTRRAKLLAAAAILFVGMNLVAYRHAWRMTHFVAAGNRTASPQQLSVLGKLAVLVRGVEVPKPANDAASSNRVIRVTTRDHVGIALEVLPAATNDTVVLLFPGYATCRSVMRGEARCLQELGVRCVLVDFRGTGDADGAVTTLGCREALDVAAAFQWARREWPDAKVVLYGSSMGAVAILHAIATEAVRPQGIILESPFDKLLTTVGHRYHTMGLPAFPFAHLLVLWGGAQHGFNAFAFQPVKDARSVHCPALVFGGEHDAWVRPAEARRVADAISDSVTCQIFAAGGHCGYSKSCPVEYRSILKDWFRTHLFPNFH
jgi:uncharacterized protein